MRNFLLLLLGVTACSTSQAGEAETPLAMADSARAHISRSDKAMQAGDSAAYMAGFAAEMVLAGEGMIFKDRSAYAQHVGRLVRTEKVADVGTSAEEIRVVGPKAVAITANFHYTKTDSAGKPEKVTGVWSGVLGVEGGRTVVLQQHTSEPTSPQ